jgi:hypothetical protein
LALLSGSHLFGASALHAERISDIRNTKHNLSVTGPGPVRAVSESQICVFCHTPHGAEQVPAAPLWNRQISGAAYTPYMSTSIDAADIAGEPGGSSKLCLSCHDGTLAIGTVNVANGQVNPAITMTGTGPGGTMNPGQGPQTGFTRNLGVDLTNDHPISFTYDSSLAQADGELRDPSLETHIAERVPGTSPAVPLELGKLECVSCHDPHIRDSDPSVNIKFLRLNRFQVGAPSGGAFNQTNDIVCLACHDKLSQVWAQSAHADFSTADEQYRDEAANLREFPAGTRVWQAACLNCHDTHTVQGARRLLREGTDALGSLTSPKSGGQPSIEDNCYQCHTTGAESILTSVVQVPDIRTDFLLSPHMPIASQEQRAGFEVHDVVNADLIEPQLLLGKGDLVNRHAECTDCHNPHRVLKNRLFNGFGVSPAGTHEHGPNHTNIASGVLRGSWGVEPNYGSTSFQILPSSYTVKQGDPGPSGSTAPTSPFVTREYQVCLKCHSDFGYDDNNLYPTGNRPDLSDSLSGTPSGTNGLTQYTNQAREIQAPLSHQGEGTAANSGAGPGFENNNHRSWHPVVGPTGRDTATRNMSGSTNLFLAPWNATSIGSQTMFCSDCHGSATTTGTVVPNGGEDGNPWGPHGSSNDFILKGSWDATTGTNDSGLCFRCHNHTNYATEQNENSGANFASGFGGPDDSNLHAMHAKRIGTNLNCSWCHVAVPHGWKNKALLVNLNDVGPEAGLSPGTEVPIGSSNQTYNQEPYYWNAKLKIRTFQTSGSWTSQDCGSASGTPSTGRDWMKDVCENPP